jgi:hypothetical protein
MNPVNKALWFIESNFARDITLDDMAEVAGVSRFHLSRLCAFDGYRLNSLHAGSAVDGGGPRARERREGFDSRTGIGSIEIWIPLAAS